MFKLIFLISLIPICHAQILIKDFQAIALTTEYLVPSFLKWNLIIDDLMRINSFSVLISNENNSSLKECQNQPENECDLKCQQTEPSNFLCYFPLELESNLNYTFVLKVKLNETQELEEIIEEFLPEPTFELQNLSQEFDLSQFKDILRIKFFILNLDSYNLEFNLLNEWDSISFCSNQSLINGSCLIEEYTEKTTDFNKTIRFKLANRIQNESFSLSFGNLKYIFQKCIQISKSYKYYVILQMKNGDRRVYFPGQITVTSTLPLVSALPIILAVNNSVIQDGGAVSKASSGLC